MQATPPSEGGGLVWVPILILLILGAGVVAWFALDPAGKRRHRSGGTGAAALGPVPTDEAGLRGLSRDPAWLARGRQVYDNICWNCHGKVGEGTLQGPNLRDGSWISEPTMTAILTTIRDGREGTAMLAMKEWYSPTDLAAVAAYVADLHRHPGPAGKDPEGLNGPITW